MKIKYLEYSAQYANQTVINGSADELFIDFSSGPVPDAETGQTIIPIHTRIAMSHASGRRLLAALQQSLNRVEVSSQGAAKGAAKNGGASLPPIN